MSLKQKVPQLATITIFISLLVISLLWIFIDTRPVTLTRVENAQYSVLVPENFKSEKMSASDQIYSKFGRDNGDSKKYLTITVRKGSYGGQVTQREALDRFDVEWKKGAFKTVSSATVTSIQKMTVDGQPARKVTGTPTGFDAKKNVMTSLYVFGTDTMYLVTASTYDETPKNYRNAVDDIVHSFDIN